MSDTKVYLIIVAIFIIGVFSVVAYTEYSENEVVVACIDNGKTWTDGSCE